MLIANPLRLRSLVIRTPVTKLCFPACPFRKPFYQRNNVEARAEGRAERSTDSVPSATAYLEAAVPKDQRPVNELGQLKDDMLYSWGSLELQQYLQRLVVIFGFFMAVLGGPIAYQTFNPSDQPFEWVLSATVGSLVVVAILVVRIFLGWAYVSDRLLSATYAYEETGWYDGQTFVKPPEVLTRDRLLGMYETKPVLQKLKVTLVGSGVMLLMSSVLLFGIIKAESDEYGMYGRNVTKGTRPVSAGAMMESSGIEFKHDSLDAPDITVPEMTA